MKDFRELLGREELEVDPEAISGYLTDSVILVTGAGGSIGSELCRQIATFGPRLLVLFGREENSIYEIQMELMTRFSSLTLVPAIGNAEERNRVRRVFEEYSPDVVFHTAAYKQLPLMEHNPEEAVKNNVGGTRNIASAAVEYSARKLLMTSTDKAVRPTSVYGATKRIGEQILQSLGQGRTLLITVRFVNVFDSRGSVVPLFKKQIELGGPVTVTHPDVRRCYMTIPEAARLVLQSGAMGRGGEIFVLDAGEQIRIIDLAKSLIRLAGKEPGVDIRIEFTGLRPGEKLHEEILTEDKWIESTEHPKIFASGSDDIDPEKLSRDVEELIWLAERPDRDGIRRKLREMVPEYTP